MTTGMKTTIKVPFVDLHRQYEALKPKIDAASSPTAPATW